MVRNSHVIGVQKIYKICNACSIQKKCKICTFFKNLTKTVVPTGFGILSDIVWRSWFFFFFSTKFYISYIGKKWIMGLKKTQIKITSDKGAEGTQNKLE